MGLPVLMMNPCSRGDMAARKRRRRRKNPTIDFVDLALGLVGGVGIGSAAYALDGANLTQNMKAGITAGVGLVLGATAMWAGAEGVGLGLVGGGAAVATHKLLATHVTGSPSGNGDEPSEEAMGALEYRRRFRRPDMPVGAIEAPLGAVDAPLGRNAWYVPR